MAVMLKGHNMPGWCACCTPERWEGQGPTRRALRRVIRKRENREWRKDAEREIREAYYYDADDIDEYEDSIFGDDLDGDEVHALAWIGSPVWSRGGEI
jgi:hypothetical protein